MQRTETTEWLFAEDLQREYRMGRSKAYLVLSQTPGVVRIGKRKAIRRAVFEGLLASSGLDLKWPK